MTTKELAIVNGTACVLAMVEQGTLKPEVLVNVIDQFCNANGTEYIAELLMKMPCYDKLKAILDSVEPEPEPVREWVNYEQPQIGVTHEWEGMGR